MPVFCVREIRIKDIFFRNLPVSAVRLFLLLITYNYAFICYCDKKRTNLKVIILLKAKLIAFDRVDIEVYAD